MASAGKKEVPDLNLEFFFTVSKAFIISAAVIFFLRVIDMSIDTVRLLFVIRGKKILVWILGALQSTIFFLAVSQALRGDANFLTTLGYAFGFATGNVIGMMIEERLAIGFQRVTVTTLSNPESIAIDLRRNGYGVTEMTARGKDGEVAMLHVNCKRKQVTDVEAIVFKHDDKAFLTVDDFIPVRETGYWRK